MNGSNTTKGSEFPKVSILIPAYNQEQYIEQAVSSALNQNYQNIEVVVADNCSIDSTQKLCEKFFKDERFVYKKNSNNIGRVANYHKLVYEYATGDYALILDGDDYLLGSDFIRKAVSLFQTDNNVSMVFAGIQAFFERDKTFARCPSGVSRDVLLSGEEVFLDFNAPYHIWQLAVLYDIDKLRTSGGYVADITSTDWESELRLMIGSKVGYINTIASVWRKHNNNISRSANLEEIINNLRFIDSPYKYALKLETFSPKVLEKWRNRMYKEYFLKHILRAKLSKNISLESCLFDALAERNDRVYKQLKRDPRLLGFSLVSQYPRVTYAIFKMMGLEFFIKDYISIRE